MLLNGKAPSHEVDTLTYIKGLLYKHIMDSNKKFLALVIPKPWHFTLLVEAHDKLGHQGVNRTYLIKCHYYWICMNKNICKYITNCALCKRENARTQVYTLYMTDIPDRPFDNKVSIDLVSDLIVSTSGNQHIMTIIYHLRGWPEAFPIPDKKADTIVHVFINNYFHIHMCPQFILSHNGTEFKNQLMDNVLKHLDIDCIFSVLYHPQSKRVYKYRVYKYLKPTL